MEETEVENLDVAAAIGQVEQADALARQSGAALLPSLSASDTATRSLSSNNIFSGVSSGSTSSATSATGTLITGSTSNTPRTDLVASFSASYQLDFWGRNRALYKGAQDTATASRWNRQTVQLTSLASTATTYFNILAARERIAYAKQDIRDSSGILKLIKDRQVAGTATDLDVAQQAALVATLKASIPPLQVTVDQNIAALAILLGRVPERVEVAGKSVLGNPVPLIAPGIPSEVLTLRPDVEYAESNLAAAHANLVAARAAFFPTLTLTAQGGFESLALKTLFSPASTFYTAALGLAQPIFDGGLLQGQFDQVKGEQDQLLAEYRKAVITAFSDVDKALAALKLYAQQEQLTRESLAASRRAYDLSSQRLTAGVLDVVTLLQTEQTLFTTQDTLVQVRLLRMTEAVALYQALGGAYAGRPETVRRKAGRDRVGIAGDAEPRKGGTSMNRLWRAVAWIAGITVVAALLVPPVRNRIFNRSASTQTAVQAGGKRKRNTGDAIPVLTATARQADVPVYVEGVGTGQALNSVLIRSQVDGVLNALNFVEGQDVKAGALIAKIDPRLYQATLDQDVAKKALDEATLLNARRDLTRYQLLASQKAGTQQQADTQVAVVAQDVAQVAIDQAMIDSAKTTLSYTDVTSPIAGRTGIRNVDVGNVIHATDTTGIVTVSQIQPISVIFNVPQQDLPRINKASLLNQLDVQALDSNGAQAVDHGVLAVVNNTIDATTGTVKLKANFQNPKLQLWPGIFVNVRLQVETLKGAIVIPVGALQRGPKGAFVFAAVGNKAAIRNVTVGQQDDTQAVISTGLKADDIVITSGFQKMTDGATIKTSPDPAFSQAGAPALHEQGVTPPSDARPPGAARTTGAPPRPSSTTE